MHPEKTSLRDMIRAAYAAEWHAQKDGERTLSRALALGALAGLDKPARALTYADIVRARHRLGLSKASQNRAVAALRSAYKVTQTPGPSWPKQHPEARVIDSAPTRAEVALFLKKAPPALARVARLLYATGMRRSELLQARYSDFRLEPGIAAGAWLTLHDSKNGTARDVPIPARCCGLVRRWLRELLEDPSLAHERTIKYSDSTLSLHWRAVTAGSDGSTSLGLRNLRPHRLRHARATELIRAGTPIPIVAKILGHRDWSTTMRYTHPDQGDLMRAADAAK